MAVEERGAFTAQLFAVRYGRNVPSDGILIMVPSAGRRSVRVFYGTPERGGELDAISALATLKRDEAQQ